MKKLFVLLIIMLIPVSCSLFNPELNIEFDRKILDGYFVISIAFEDDGTTWMGTLGSYGQGLIRYSAQGTQIYDHSNSIINDSTTIGDIEIDSQGRVWFGNDGLVCYDEGDFTRYDTSNSPIPVNNIRSIAIDSEDRVWFASGYFGEVSLISFDGSTFTVYTSENSELPVNSIGDIEVDHNNNVWMAMRGIIDNICLTKFDRSIWITYNVADLGFTPYLISDIEINNHNEIYGIIDYSLSSAMYDNRPSLFVFNGQNPAIVLSDSGSFHYSCIDQNNHIWCSGFGSLAVYDGQNLSFLNTSHSSFAIKESPSGEMWIGSGDGVYIYKK